MKMKKAIISLTSLVLLLSACGPSKEEQEAKEKAKMDSVANATQNNIVRQQAIQDSITAAGANQEAMKQQLIDLKSQLAAEQTKMDDVQGFKIGRSEDEKQQQVADQTKVIETIKGQISDLEKQIK